MVVANENENGKEVVDAAIAIHGRAQRAQLQPDFLSVAAPAGRGSQSAFFARENFEE